MNKKQALITDFYQYKSEKIYGYNHKTNSWHCLGCGEDMGEHNPRQYCRKSFCPEIHDFNYSQYTFSKKQKK